MQNVFPKGYKMSACSTCLHDFECFEKRGRCREYKDLKGVIEDIEMLHQKAKLAAGAEADKAAAGKRRAGNQPETSGSAESQACRRD